LSLTFARAADGPTFFDPLVTDAPGISREVGALAEHVHQADSPLTRPSVRLQYPVLQWIQFSLEVPIAFRDDGSSALGTGDLLAVGRARVFVRPTGVEHELDFEDGRTLRFHAARALLWQRMTGG
jgi:hypothetical protein